MKEASKDQDHNKRRNVCLSDELAKKAIRIGGDVSKGVRKAIKAYDEDKKPK